MLRLVKGSVVICQVGVTRQVSLAPGRKLVGGVTTMDIDLGWSVLGVNDALVFFDWTKDENDVIMHKSKSLTSFPRSEDRAVIHFVLSFGEDLDGSMTPIWV